MIRRGLLIFALLAGCAQVSAPNTESSVLGSDGLVAWLRANGVATEVAGVYSTRNAEDLSLRIQPLLDINLYNDEAELIGPDSRQTLRDLDGWVYNKNQTALATLVILPKWRGGAMDRAQMQRNLLVGPMELRSLVAQFNSMLRVTRTPEWVEATVEIDGSHRIALFHAQLFVRSSIPENCSELLGLPQGALIVDCAPDGLWKRQILLSDPDLMNNHGLALAQNGNLALVLMRRLQDEQGGKPLYMDRGNRVSVSTGEIVAQPPPEPGWGPLLRWPLPLFWALGALVLLLSFWRGARRFGAPLRDGADPVEISRTAAVDAKAQLLRLSGNDGQMVSDYVRAQMQALAAGVYGTSGRNDTGVDRVMARLSRRAPALAGDFARVVQALQAAPEGAGLYRELTQFRDLLGKVKDELG